MSVFNIYTVTNVMVFLSLVLVV